MVLSQDFAGLGGDVKYVRTRVDATKYFRLPKDFLLSIHGEAGYIHPLRSDPGPGRDAIRLSDRFFGAQMRGFDIRGIGPRIQRVRYTSPTDFLRSKMRFPTRRRSGYTCGRIELKNPWPPYSQPWSSSSASACRICIRYQKTQCDDVPASARDDGGEGTAGNQT